MYFMKESLDHRPIIMIAKTGTPPRYIAIADPDLIERLTLPSHPKLPGML